jgi:hypothetical protein
VSVVERVANVTTVAATDADQPAQTLTYTIVGGADAALFSIDPSTGALRFISAPDFDAPADAGADNIYDVIVQASDGTFATAQNLSVTVTEVSEAVLDFPLPDAGGSSFIDEVHVFRSSGTPNAGTANPSPSGASSARADAVLTASANSAAASSLSLYRDASPRVLRTVEDMIRSSRSGPAAEEIAIKAWWAGVQASQHSHEHDEHEWRISPASGQHPYGDGDTSGAFDEWVLHAGLASLSAGVTWWTGRSSGLLASVLASVRAWQSFDLLPVLKRDEKEKRRLLLDEQHGDEEEGPSSGPQPGQPGQPKTPAMQLEADE